YLMLLLPSTSTLFPYTTLFRSRADAAGGSDGAAVEAGLPHRQDPSDAVPGAEHRQCAVLRGHRGVGGGVDADSRLGVRQPGDLSDGADAAGGVGEAAGSASGAGGGADAVAVGGDDVPAGAAACGGGAAGDDGGGGHVGAAERVCDQPGV